MNTDTLVAVGDMSSRKTEKFQNGNWIDVEDIPADGTRMYHHAVLFYAGNFYNFGGVTRFTEQLSSIFCLNGVSWTWSNVGQMISPRYGHAVISIENRFMVVGGVQADGNLAVAVPALKHEVCTLNNGFFSCTAFNSSLTNFYNTPVLYHVDKNYRTC